MTPRSRALARVALPSAAVLLVLLSVSACPAAFRPSPSGEPGTVRLSGGKTYLQLDPVRPLVVELQGPGEFYGYARCHFAEGRDDPVSGRLLVTGVPDLPATHPLTFEPSGSASYADARDGSPSGGRKFRWELPEGIHRVELRGDCDGGADMFVILYYEGPPQPGALSASAGPGRRPASRKGKKPAFTLRKSAGMEFIYDSNITGLSDDDLEDLNSIREGITAADADVALDPDGFRLRSEDDAIMAPSLDLELRRRFVDWGQTRLRTKIKAWRYLYNPIKNNLQWDWYLRQYLGKGRSLELSYFYAPEQYIRQLGDTPPGTDPEETTVKEEFRFTKNVVALTLRQKLSKRLDLKVIYERNLRYYNQPFMENDIEAWEVRGNLTAKLHRRLTASVDYSYEDGPARGIDEAGETKESSDNSDASYLRDLYRVGLTWRQPFLRRFFDRIDVSGLAMFYWYPADFKAPFEDRFHVGRKDNVYKATIEVRRKLAKGLTGRLGTRYTERTIDSPWPDVIVIDKAYTKFRIWFSLTYSL